MAYVTQERNRAATLAAVGALHAGAIYALVVGLAGPAWPIVEDKPVRGVNIPLPPVPPETVERARSDAHPRTDPIHNRTIDEPIVDAVEPIVRGATADGGLSSSSSGEDKAGEITMPPLPPLPPVPNFSPKGAVPRGSPGSWVTPNDYPAFDLRAGHEGITRFQLSIGSDGRVLSCEITVSSGYPSLDRAACANLKARGRFTAATDASGAAVPGTYANAVRWKLPKDY